MPGVYKTAVWRASLGTLAVSPARARDDLSGTLDAVEDRVVPGRIVERRKEQFRSRLSGIKETVMGSADDLSQGTGEVGGQLTDRLSDANDWAHQAPAAARRRAAGNPLAAGLIAFGVGLLAAAIFRATQTEGQVAQKVQDAAQPVAEEAKQAGKELVSNLKPAAGARCAQGRKPKSRRPLPGPGQRWGACLWSRQSIGPPWPWSRLCVIGHPNGPHDRPGGLWLSVPASRSLAIGR